MRVEPGDLELRHLSIGKVEIGEDYVFEFGLEVGGTAGADRCGLLVEQVQDYRDIMRGETPEGVFVAADDAEVNAL